MQAGEGACLVRGANGLTRREFLRLSAGAAGGTALASSAAGCGVGARDRGTNSITYWASNQGASIQQDEEILGEVIARFEKQTGIRVGLRVISWEDLYNELLTATISGQGPDVVNIGNTWAIALQASDAFQPFDRRRFGDVGGRGKFIEAALNASSTSGQAPTSLPLYGLAYGLFYNRRMFEEEGIEKPPETWAEFVEVGKRLTKDTDGDGEIDQRGLALEGASVTENAHWAFILSRQQGGRLFDDDNQPTFDSPENVGAVKRYVDFLAADGIAAPNNAEYSDGTQAPADFANGKAAMIMFQNGVQLNLEAGGMGRDEYGIAAVPVPGPLPEGGEPIKSHTAGINIAVFDNTDNRAAANKFVRFMTDERQQVYLNREFGSLPVNKRAQQHEAFRGGDYAVFNRVYEENSAPMPLIPQESEMETIIGDALTGLFAEAATGGGKITEEQVREALTAAEKTMPPISERL